MAGVSAILTAAGESRRMGRPKPLLPWRGATLVERQIEALRDGGADEVVVVLGHRADEVAEYVGRDGVRAVVNAAYREGKTTSIKAGLRAAAADAGAIMLLAVDQPRTAGIVAAVIGAHRASGALITSPRYQGHGGHPLVFDAALRGELSRVSEGRQGIREVFMAHRGDVNEFAMDDAMVRVDMNTPEAYAAAFGRYGGE